MWVKTGDRVRCVNNESGFGEMLTLGAEYRIRKTDDNLVSVEPVELRDDLPGLRKTAFVASRFKPVVRVMMRTCPRGSNPPHPHSDIVE